MKITQKPNSTGIFTRVSIDIFSPPKNAINVEYRLIKKNIEQNFTTIDFFNTYIALLNKKGIKNNETKNSKCTVLCSENLGEYIKQNINIIKNTYIIKSTPLLCLLVINQNQINILHKSLSSNFTP